MQHTGECEAPVSSALEFVARKMREEGKAPCSPVELDTVLINLQERNAVIYYEDERDKTWKVVFTV
jgi:hypothetical protein